MADLDKKVLNCQVTIDIYTDIRKQVNVIFLVVGRLVPKSCKLPNHLLKKETKQFWFPPAMKVCFDISQSVDSLFIFLMLFIDEQKILILVV